MGEGFLDMMKSLIPRGEALPAETRDRQELRRVSAEELAEYLRKKKARFLDGMRSNALYEMARCDTLPPLNSRGETTIFGHALILGGVKKDLLRGGSEDRVAGGYYDLGKTLEAEKWLMTILDMPSAWAKVFRYITSMPVPGNDTVPPEMVQNFLLHTEKVIPRHAELKKLAQVIDSQRWEDFERMKGFAKPMVLDGKFHGRRIDDEGSLHEEMVRHSFYDAAAAAFAETQAHLPADKHQIGSEFVAYPISELARRLYTGEIAHFEALINPQPGQAIPPTDKRLLTGGG